jgi:L-fucose isomerase-like protein
MAEAALAKRQFSHAGVSQRALLGAAKLYLAVKQELDQEPSIRAVGINCLNESHFSDTTPCLAWNFLYEEEGLLWGCEGDTVSMLSEHIFQKTLQAPVMMTNLYPFLMGQAALKHEHIPSFPEISQPENCILVAHCGYLGVVPQSFSTEWTLRPKVLAIVDDLATAIDARLPEGPLTLVKLSPSMAKVTVVEGTLECYVQYPGSHCVNGAVIRVPDGRNLLNTLDSHHYVLVTGRQLENIRMVAKVLGLEVEQI